jgi:Flp pilus assembly protein TadD
MAEFGNAFSNKPPDFMIAAGSVKVAKDKYSSYSSWEDACGSDVNWARRLHEPAIAMTESTTSNLKNLRICRVVYVALSAGVILGAFYPTSDASAETLPETGILAPIPKSEDPAITAIRNALSVDNFVAASAAIKLLSAKAPQSGQAEYWAGLMCMRSGKPEDAVRYLRASQKLADNEYTGEAVALAYYTARQFKLFEASMRRASERMPDNYAPYYYLGRYFVSAETTDFEQAEILLAKAVRLSPNNARSLYYLAFCQESRGRLDSSESNYRQVLTLATQDSRYHALAELGLARVAMLGNRFDEALTHARAAEAALPKEVEPHSVLAKLYAQTGENELAKREWKAVNSLDPTNTNALYHLSRLYLKTGERSLADQSFQEYKTFSKLYGTN